MWKIEEYDSVEPIIDTGWLREELGKLRLSVSPDTSATIDPSTWKSWRVVVGLAVKVKDKNGKETFDPTKKRRCTQEQAAKLVLLALWKPAGKPLLKDILGSKLNVKQLNKANTRGLFNQWIERTGGEEAGNLLTSIHQMNVRMTGKDLSELSGLMPPGKIVPVGNLARLLKEPLRSDRPCSRAATETILQWLIDRSLKYRKSGEELTIDLNQHLLPH